jgi:hypothetical protein
MLGPVDDRPMPGDIVLLRGNMAQVAWVVPYGNVSGARAGYVMPGALGLVVVSSHRSQHRSYAYVLWSTPCIAGWMSDGFLRRV